MKKSAIIIALVSFFFSSVNAGTDTTSAKSPDQKSFKRGELGFRFMPTFSSFNITTVSNSEVTAELTFGYGFGGLVAVNFTKHVGVQGEIIYNALSQKFKDKDLDRKITIKYLNIPLFLSLNTGKGNPVNLNIVGGPQIGINLGSKLETSGDADTDTLTAVLALKKGDLGLAYGAGLEFLLNPSGSVRLDLGFRGVFGLIDISDDSETQTTDSYYILDRAKIKTYSGYIGLTLLF